MSKLELKAVPPSPDVSGSETQTIELRGFHTPEAMAAPHRPATGPAESTRAQRPLQRSVLIFLLADGRITPKQLKAGEEISRIFRMLTSSVTPRVSSAYGERLDRSPDQDLPEPVRIACTERYTPWRTWAGGIAVNPARSLADLTLSICVDGHGVRQAADLLHMDGRTVKRRLQASLHWYCRNAGWLSARET